MNILRGLTELTDNQLHCHFSAVNRVVVVYAEILTEFEFEKKCDSELTNEPT